MHQPVHPIHPRHRRGAAALVVILLLFLALGLALVYAGRTLLADNRSSRDQLQTSQAFEAAEAGLEWTTAQLNDPHHLDDACQTTPLASASSLRDRLMTVDPATGTYTPRTWNDAAGAAHPVEIACTGSAAGWQCSCPTTEPPHPPGPGGLETRPSFRVRLQQGPRPGTVQAMATGCNNMGPSCLPGSGNPSEAKADVQALLALLPALFTPPSAALTTLGDVTVPAASPGFVNSDATLGGATVDAGGVFQAPAARLRSAPGAVAASSVVEGDAALKALPPERLFARHFGLDKPTWRRRPDVARVDCGGGGNGCGSKIDAALASGASLLWVDGDLLAEGPAVWGSPLRPVIVVATGELRLGDAALVHGLLYARRVVWNDAAPGAAGVRGGVIAEEGYSGSGSPDLVRDAAVLRLLNLDTGSFVRVPGSWRDFR